MKIKCEYCGNYMDDTDELCPNCHGVNNHLKRTSNQTPKTIEELKKWYTDHNLPPEETTRFFIGKNITEPRAFGIYKEDSGNFVVYKNKSDGSRAVRYKGKDEHYAVNELYMRLKEEILNQKNHNYEQRKNSDSNNTPKKSSTGDGVGLIFMIVVLCVVFTIIFIGLVDRKDGYYIYEDTYYYCQKGTWYYYDYGYNDWIRTNAPDKLRENSDRYYQSHGYDDDYEVTNFKYSDYNSKNHNSSSHSSSSYDSSWDTSSSWDSGDTWDSGSTDWSSDW